MRSLWSERSRRLLWRELWVSLAEAQSKMGLVSAEQVEELREQMGNLDIERSLEIEREIHHDKMAELKVFSEQCPKASGILHFGATSTDIEDNAEVIRCQRAVSLLIPKVSKILLTFSEQIKKWASTPTIGFTHLQPAEPTTIGYRLCQYAQDLLTDFQALQSLALKGKGIKGAVGTSASYEILSQSSLEKRVMSSFGIESWPITTQTYPRKQDTMLLNVLAGIGQSLHKFAFDLRILQNPFIGEWSEDFGEHQVGSSAMPFKRNPIKAESLCSLARKLATYPRISWDNAANSLLERTLDDSANRRMILAESFLITDEILILGTKLIENLSVNQRKVEENLQRFKPFMAIEPLLMEAVKQGGNRQLLHEKFRKLSMLAWEEIQEGRPNPLQKLLYEEEFLGLTKDQIDTAVNSDHIGEAKEKSFFFAEQIKKVIGDLQR